MFNTCDMTSFIRKNNIKIKKLLLMFCCCKPNLKKIILFNSYEF